MKSIRIVLIILAGVGATTFDEHIPLGPNHNHSQSICWGYAQGIGFGKMSGDEYYDPDKTYADQIYEEFFPYVDDDPDFSELGCGDILVWGQAPRIGQNGHAAIVKSVHSPLVLNNVVVWHVPGQGQNPVETTVGQITGQGSRRTTQVAGVLIRFF